MRARNLKPGFFKNDKLADLDPFARILFSGLWCLADCEGRIEDRPRIIKAELLPYDNVDVDALLTELSESDFVIRYTVEGTEIIQVVNFKRHQHTHPNEKPSELPAQRDIRKLPEITQTTPVMQQTTQASSLNPSSLNPSSLNKKNERENIARGNGADFDAFWKLYPRKKASDAARKAFKKAVTVASVEEIMQGLKDQLPAMASKGEFNPYPATWLNAGQWKDEPELVPKTEVQRLMEQVGL